MNGRAYDYNLGRFLSVDPFIQAPGNSQSMNPYSYIMNNPLAGTDPTGYCAETDSLKSCANSLEEGEVRDVTNDDGEAVGTVGKDSSGNLYLSAGNGKETQQAIKTSMDFLQNIEDIGSQVNREKTHVNEYTSSGDSESLDIVRDDTKERAEEFYAQHMGDYSGRDQARDMNKAGTEAAETAGTIVESLNPIDPAKAIPIYFVIKKGKNLVKFRTADVSDPKLQNIVKDLYKGADTKEPIGTGSTADAIRHEARTGQAVGGKFHQQKGEQYRNALNKWLRKNPNASSTDREAAQKLLDDLNDALDN